jgi:hypothetical protein
LMSDACLPLCCSTCSITCREHAGSVWLRLGPSQTRPWR